MALNNQALEQFETISLYSIIINKKFLITATNFNVELLVNILILVLFTTVLSYSKKLFVNNNIFLVTNMVYRFVYSVLVAQTAKKGNIYFPVVLTIFVFILVNNFNGLMPKNFCTTSQIFVTFTLSMSVFIGAVIISIIVQKEKFIWFFVPKNVPNALLPFIVCIEVVSYVSRVFSLAIRLFANMVAGHALLHIIGGAVVVGLKKLGSIHLFLPILMLFPLCILLAIIILEFGVSFLQAYVFIVLFSIYINDCYGHH